MPKLKSQTPAEVLQSYIDEYQINPFSLSKSIKMAYQSVANILKGKGKISANIAIRLAQYFGNTPQFWLDIQAQSEIAELSSDKKFTAILNKIQKAVKPTVIKAKESKTASKKRKRTTINPAVPKKADKVKSKKKVKAFKTGRKVKN